MKASSIVAGFLLVLLVFRLEPVEAAPNAIEQVLTNYPELKATAPPPLKVKAITGTTPGTPPGTKLEKRAANGAMCAKKDECASDCCSFRLRQCFSKSGVDLGDWCI